MTKKSRKAISKLKEIIDVCIYWKEQILEKTEKGNEILEEFEGEDILDVLSDYV